MMDRKEIERVFQWSDEYIKKNPDILNKSTNDIFDELDDGTKEMHHLRWGVMVVRIYWVCFANTIRHLYGTTFDRRK